MRCPRSGGTWRTGWAFRTSCWRPCRTGPAAFGDLVAATPLPAVARAHALHLLWRRRLGTDLSRPLGDGSPVWLAGGNG